MKEQSYNKVTDIVLTNCLYTMSKNDIDKLILSLQCQIKNYVTPYNVVKKNLITLLKAM